MSQQTNYYDQLQSVLVGGVSYFLKPQSLPVPHIGIGDLLDGFSTTINGWFDQTTVNKITQASIEIKDPNTLTVSHPVAAADLTLSTNIPTKPTPAALAAAGVALDDLLEPVAATIWIPLVTAIEGIHEFRVRITLSTGQSTLSTRGGQFFVSDSF
jgi:hypothetical protein